MTALLRMTKSGISQALSGLTTVGFLVLSLLPLSALLLALPAIMPDETVLTDSRRRRSLLRTAGQGLFALLLGAAALEAMVVSAIEAVGWLSRAGLLGSTRDLAANLWFLVPGVDPSRLPDAVRDHPSMVVLFIYLLDLLILLVIGRVPLAYNTRNLLVRWRITALTALAFTVVVGLLIVMLAFVKGMYQLTETTGEPGNVFVLSEGSTDEFFSDLGYKDLAKMGLERCTLDEQDRPLPVPITFSRVRVGDREVPASSRETYFTINQPLLNADGSPTGRRRFVQVRGIYDAAIAAFVHDITLKEGSWFGESGFDGENRIQCVIGEGIAGELGGAGRQLRAGDTFTLGDRPWYVSGVMKTEGTTFGSEVWGKQELLCSLFGKLGPTQAPVTTTMVMRVADDTERSARAMAYHLNNRYQEQQVRAVTEPEYYAKLSETNKQFLVAIVLIAVVMAVGGIFGVMNTMFAAISSRIKDIGVMRILGFKRWQVLVSFLLESLGIALIGGLVGVLIGWAVADGRTSTSIISSGQGGGKSVVLRLTVGADLVMTGVLFTLIMGRLGGLVPALSAMKLKILDAVR